MAYQVIAKDIEAQIAHDMGTYEDWFSAHCKVEELVDEDIQDDEYGKWEYEIRKA